MALIPQDKYPGQIDQGDPGYPYGRARNQVVEGDGTGTPLEKDLVNDILGFQQALLVGANITPTGIPDKADESQYFDAVRILIANATSSRLTALELLVSQLRTFGEFAVSGSPNQHDKFTLTERTDISPSGAFTVSNNEVILPAAGKYLVSLFGYFEISDGTGFPKNGEVTVRRGGGTQFSVGIFSASAKVQNEDDKFIVAMSRTVEIVDPNVAIGHVCVTTGVEYLRTGGSGDTATLLIRKLP